VPRPRADVGREAVAHHRIAVETYLGLPAHERSTVAKHMVGMIGNLWFGHAGDVDTGVTQPVYGPQLAAALVRHHHLDRGALARPSIDRAHDAVITSGRHKPGVPSRQTIRRRVPPIVEATTSIPRYLLQPPSGALSTTPVRQPRP
jgi:hypothetical protein